jgi:hypothetical protein
MTTTKEITAIKSAFHRTAWTTKVYDGDRRIDAAIRHGHVKVDLTVWFSPSGDVEAADITTGPANYLVPRRGIIAVIYEVNTGTDLATLYELKMIS